MLTFDSCLAKATPSTKFTDNKLCYSPVMNTADSASAKKILTSFKSILFLGLPLSSSKKITKIHCISCDASRNHVGFSFKQRKWIVVIYFVKKISDLRRANDFANTVNAWSQHVHTTDTSE